MSDDANDVKSSIGDDIRNVDPVSAAIHAKDAAVEYGRQGYQYAADVGRQAKQRTEGYIHQNPWYAIGIALGAGVLLGILLSNSRQA